ncbi:uncharacterized protein LOC103641046 [Zea mays]|uniref:Enhancer of polycomb-like protein n=1 Tax=Zea mays TaxID=4577 RepID=A0A1D6IXL7_MAIZE|nr:uncharacterized protein LOC103641046 [Zea mays]AQK40651.1 Enhancer of polycomb-like transcription factor protein [Zea mays]|eukprot:NP_001333640.1 uncharacterized LOC103641046 [Zea mays]
MPAAGARRSTRVFMPKAAKPPQSQEHVDPATRVLRSGKRLAADRIRWDAKEAAAFHVDINHGHDQQHQKEDYPKPGLPALTKSFGLVYRRKRRRRRRHPADEVVAEDEDGSRRFGIVYTRRKGKRSKVSPLLVPQEPEVPCDIAAAIPCSSSREFASRTGFLDAHFSALVDDAVTYSGAQMLVILVDTSCSGSSHRLTGLLVPMLRWMRRSWQRGKFRNLATFIFSSGIAAAFASHGVHFVKLQCQSASALLHRPLAHCGWCVLHGSKKSEPLLSVDFSALPSYFSSLHYAVALDSMYLSAMIQHSRLLVEGSEEIYPRSPLYLESGAQSSGFAATAAGNNEPCRVVPNYMPLEQVAGLVAHGLRLKKHQRRRTMRHPRNRRRLIIARLPDNGIGMKHSTTSMQTEENVRSSRQGPPVEPVYPKAALEISLDLLENMDESDVSTPIGSARRKRSSLKSPVERMNEKVALAEVRQNIDSVQSKANLLNLQADRCWREEGAEVMLELSDTNKWCIVVKIQGITRYSLKPSDVRSYVINRHSQAYMWAVDDAWKLEFTDKWDWLLFKELHVVGRERNSQGKTIPIPGVHEVSDGMEGIVTDPFSRPVPDYIRMVDDEVGRAISRDSIYDMDSEDEQWLIQLNPADSDSNSSQRNHLSYEDFERIISIFEKDAYNNAQGKNDLSEFFYRYPALGKDDNVHAVYKYWTSKRSKRAAPLLRVFQGAPIRRGHLSQKSAMKRKRSFKRQKSQAGRGKPEALLQYNAEEDAALHRVAQAERAAKQAVERAIRLRNRAQSLMTNAELAAYKSVMALRIAEAARISDSSRDIVCTILD